MTKNAALAGSVISLVCAVASIVAGATLSHALAFVCAVVFVLAFVVFGVVWGELDARRPLSTDEAPAVPAPVAFDPFAPTGDVMAVEISAADRVQFQVNDTMFKGAYANRYPHDIWQH